MLCIRLLPGCRRGVYVRLLRDGRGQFGSGLRRSRGPNGDPRPCHGSTDPNPARLRGGTEIFWSHRAGNFICRCRCCLRCQHAVRESSVAPHAANRSDQKLRHGTESNCQQSRPPLAAQVWQRLVSLMVTYCCARRGVLHLGVVLNKLHVYCKSEGHNSSSNCSCAWALYHGAEVMKLPKYVAPRGFLT